MTHAELYAITAQGPAVIMVAKDDMLALLDRAERAEAGIAAAVAEERDRCAQIAETAVDECSASYCGQCYPDALTVRDCPDNGTRIAAAIRARGTP